MDRGGVRRALDGRRESRRGAQKKRKSERRKGFLFFFSIVRRASRAWTSRRLLMFTAEIGILRRGGIIEKHN
ncbi:hypothetical protein P280DRAFT_464766 [Massarina eburnea CBS 473.64]|uniref:Uncharacterized protein n=1 Tax=Massarina eburnea CBS 473.64 TaxID=1395130 RepID=A0A6A6SFM1_9PLEO|nr:hypothetical protein P280DRAFT_464766 [Massarina eburnea CBS 473.64]